MTITLATLPQASAQEVFDQVKNHLLTQMKKSQINITGNSKCLYRSEELKCAAGCLISDAEYQHAFETIGSWGELAERKQVPGSHLRLIIDLQELHDYNELDEWVPCLEALAKQHNLTY